MSFPKTAAVIWFALGAFVYSPIAMAQVGGGEELPSNAKSSSTATSGVKSHTMSKKMKKHHAMKKTSMSGSGSKM